MKRFLSPLIFAGVLAAWSLYAVVVKDVVTVLRGENESPGEFGDSFGALNTLFTGLAFAGLVVSITQQHAELTLQREELKLQREALEAQRDELTLQREVLKAQSDELAAQAAAMKRSAEAHERTAVAQEKTANAQARSALIAAKAERLRALILSIQEMGSSGSGEWLQRRNVLKQARDKVTAELASMAEASEE